VGTYRNLRELIGIDGNLRELIGTGGNLFPSVPLVPPSSYEFP
jgi:hypothetical protein